MHELSLITEVLQIAGDALERQGAEGRVSRLTLVVGKLSGASPEALRSAFPIAAHGTPFGGAELEIEEPGPVVHCYDCGAEQEVEGFVFECPACGSGSISIEGGSELRLASMDVED